MTEQKATRMVDQSALKVNQAFIITLLIAAFLLDSWLLVTFVSLVMLLGTAVPRLALFQGIYKGILRLANLVKAHVVPDNPEPHRFAQGFGGVVLAVAVATLLLGQAFAGWALVWVVMTLAGLNLFLGFCFGCFLYYQLNRLNVPGFERSPLRQS